tara:strand:- start:1762 stop:2526 length:765 start_codon:yes stop_codon:yes gene_type:complete
MTDEIEETEAKSKHPELDIVMMSVDELIVAEYNPRTLSTKKFEDIRDSLTKFGFVDPVVINENPDRKNIIVGGHQRIKVARKMGLTEIPAVFVNLSFDDEKELNVRLNKNQGEWDYNMLKSQFKEDELVDWGFTERELADHWRDIQEMEESAEDIEAELGEKKYPIVPKYNERYSTFMIFCNNELDIHWMRNFLGLTKSQLDYKSNVVAPSYVLNATQFQDKMFEHLENAELHDMAAEVAEARDLSIEEGADDE